MYSRYFSLQVQNVLHMTVHITGYFTCVYFTCVYFISYSRGPGWQKLSIIQYLRPLPKIPRLADWFSSKCGVPTTESGVGHCSTSLNPHYATVWLVNLSIPCQPCQPCCYWIVKWEAKLVSALGWIQNWCSYLTSPHPNSAAINHAKPSA